MKNRQRTWCLVPQGPVPEDIKEQLKKRLLKHVEKKWAKHVKKLLMRFHGAYAYIATVEAKRGEKFIPQVFRRVDKNEIPIELCRLGYFRTLDKWEYYFFTYSTERYVPCIVKSGSSFYATPEQAFDSSAKAHLIAGF